MSSRYVPPPPTKFGNTAATGAIQAKRPAVPLAAAPPAIPARWSASAPPTPQPRPNLLTPVPMPVTPGATIQRATGPARLQPPPPPHPLRSTTIQRANDDMIVESSDDSDDEADDDDEPDDRSTEWTDTGLSLRGGKQGGWALKGETLYVRESRSYSSDRDRQLLRHFSSQLFFLAKSKVNTAQEIQTMVVNGNLFVAANDDDDIQAIYDELKSDLAKNLKTTLTKTWTSDPSGAYWVHTRTTKKKATARFAKKFTGLYEGTRQNKLQTGHEAVDPAVIWGVIQNANIERLKAWREQDVRQAIGGSGKIFLVFAGNRGRHAEEKLMDLLESADHKGVVLIAGKKRPCKTCLGRLEYMTNQGYRVTHSKQPGFIWKERYEAQPEEVKQFTFKVIKRNESYVTVRSKNKKKKSYSRFPGTYAEKPDFASDSDSDDD